MTPEDFTFDIQVNQIVVEPETSLAESYLKNTLGLEVEDVWDTEQQCRIATGNFLIKPAESWGTGFVVGICSTALFEAFMYLIYYVSNGCQ